MNQRVKLLPLNKYNSLTNNNKYSIICLTSKLQMTDSKRYRIEEFATTGWELIEVTDVNLSKEECDAKLQEYIASGHNPNKLRVQRES